MHTNDLRKLARETNDGVLRGPALGAADEIDRLRAEIERLTKERDAQYEENVNRIAMQAKAEAERDEALVQMAGAFEVAAQTLIDRFAEADADKIRALVPAGAQTALQSMLADAERDMRQRAAELIPPGNLRSEVLALPLKHADREGGV